MNTENEDEQPVQLRVGNETVSFDPKALLDGMDAETHAWLISLLAQSEHDCLSMETNIRALSAANACNFASKKPKAPQWQVKAELESGVEWEQLSRLFADCVRSKVYLVHFVRLVEAADPFYRSDN